MHPVTEERTLTAFAEWPDGVDRIVLDEVDSTMAEAVRRARDLERPTWIMARHQTAARGRRGRTWQNPPGNFAATLIWQPDATPAEAALRTFTASNALFVALAGKVPQAQLSLKWPNDVLLSGGKVAGILLESSGAAERLDWLAVGFGVNLVEAPSGLRDAQVPPACLRDAGIDFAPEELLARLAGAMAEDEALLDREGFGPVRNAWLSRAARLGDTLTVRTGTAEITGVFETLDEAGQLVLRTSAGQVAIPAGDVSF
ncbi:MAG: biotin--[acetyl-CoA-carboxylase] ligase [Boseongicola sp. SB0676_bin_33]|uniref:biotin--[biotin carboxyl-carrier protein] ligase n=1 Tax=Boseongicola sp. SB0664_bin_43 TaxID=2604844 RepID=A0A6B0Y590_9RHOB|nr:biotin--[acetyl-CoA-carboxylase] ligase [Boseongicola sp. SB0664_bin_43]MYF89899.1 biotin--[acetyl-CoA-carboxylase] ligase [Boseongicola sp. SB0676_bin_33]